MMNNDPIALFEPTLRPKDFHEVDLSKQQLRIWTDLTGYQPEGREEGKWRRFSPADVFRLAVMRELKGRTGLAITEHPSLVKAIGADDFFHQSVSLWAAAKQACLATDLREDHHVMGAAEVDTPRLLQSATLFCLLDLAPSIRLMRLAVVRGGSEKQRLLCHYLEIAREASSSAGSGTTATTPALVAATPKPAHRKGSRAIDFEEANVFHPRARRDEP
jgi:hypothetical protein